jgi:hypothetical protein
MEIEKIIYDTTREVFNVEDKLKIATIFLFCDRLGSKKFAELLYTEKHEEFVNNLNAEFEKYEIDLKINFANKNVSNAFFKTLNKVIEKEDSNGFYKAVYENDEFAMVICELVQFNFSKRDFKKLRDKIGEQLTLF